MKPKPTPKSSEYEALKLLVPEFYESLSGAIRRWGVPFDGLPPTSPPNSIAKEKGEE